MSTSQPSVKPAFLTKASSPRLTAATPSSGVVAAVKSDVRPVSDSPNLYPISDPNGRNVDAFLDQNGSKTVGAKYTYVTYIGECPLTQSSG